MKCFSSIVPFFAALVAAQTGNVDVSNFYVDKHEDPFTLRITIHSVSFTLNGLGADNLRCELFNPPTFPTDIFPCIDNESNYRIVVTTGPEGSGIQFGVGLYYDDDDQLRNMQGDSHIPTFCTPNEEDHDWREFRYDCKQLVSASVDLACTFRCVGDSKV